MILTTDEAAEALNMGAASDLPGKVVNIYLPAIDAMIKDATGKDWGTLTDSYTTIHPSAKLAASALLVSWWDDPGMVSKIPDGVVGIVGQLHSIALIEAAT